MTQDIEDLRYQLEEWLAQGFACPEDRANYQTLKEQYEDETLDYSFSKRELTGQLELIIINHEYDLQSLNEASKYDYLKLVKELEEFDIEQAVYYRGLFERGYGNV